MSLEAKLTTDLKAAMKAKDQAALRTIRAIKAAIMIIKTDGSGTVLDEAGEIKLLRSTRKRRDCCYRKVSTSANGDRRTDRIY